MADGLQAPSKTRETQTKLKNDGCTWWRAWKCHSRKLLSERQTLHLRVAGFGDDGAMPVAIAAARYRVAARARALADESGECYLLRQLYAPPNSISFA